MQMTRAECSRQTAINVKAQRGPVPAKIVEVCHEGIDEAAEAGNQFVDFRLADKWLWATPTQEQFDEAMQTLLTEGYGVRTTPLKSNPTMLIHFIW